MNIDPEKLFKKLFLKFVDGGDPYKLVIKNLPKKPQKNIFVVGIGKASIRMAEGVEKKWGAVKGIILTTHKFKKKFKKIKTYVGSHPKPSLDNFNITKKICKKLENLNSNDFVLFLISGGGSALLCYPRKGLSFKDKQSVHIELVKNGISIKEINIIRKHLSNVKGGQLATFAYPCEMMSLIISDVVGDKLSDISSGPTTGETSTNLDAISIIKKNKINVSKNVLSVLNRKSSVINPNDFRLRSIQNLLIGNFYNSFLKIEKWAKKNNFKIYFLGDDIEGEARKVAIKQARIAKKLQSKMKEKSKPILLISGGECTVRLKKNGNGGPNQEFVLSALIELNGHPNISVMACDTDGIDGNSKMAGAFATSKTLKNSKKIGLNPKEFLEKNNSSEFFKRVGSSIYTGPTNTNINDIRVFYIKF